MPGKIIAICGVDGVGKSTLCEGLRCKLRDDTASVEFFARSKRGADRLALVEKYVGTGGQADPWLRGNFATLVSDGLLLDFLESYHEFMEPAYRRGSTLICDRYTPCFFAYIRTVQQQWVFEKALVKLPPPDLVLYLSASPSVRAARQATRGGSKPDEDPRLQDEFDRAYRTYLHESRCNWREVNADRSAPEVLAQTWDAIAGFLGKREARAHG